MNNQLLKVTVVIPTFQRGPEIVSRAINSVLNQSYKNIEIIIVDDNHNDSDHRKQLEEYMMQFKDQSDIKYIKNCSNIGGSLSRNKGIELAKGDYITFLDDDDEFLSDKIQKQLAYMIDNNCDMTFTNLKLVNEDKVIIDFREYTDITSLDKKNLIKYHIMRHITGTPTFMYKASSLKSIGGFDDVKMGQEFFLMLKTIESGMKICYLNDCDTIAYRHHQGISYGPNKINGELSLFEFKKRYFNMFSYKEKRFITFRHNVVMTVAYKRNNQYFKMIYFLIKTVCSSPKDTIIETFKYMNRIMKNRGNRK